MFITRRYIEIHISNPNLTLTLQNPIKPRPYNYPIQTLTRPLPDPYPLRNPKAILSLIISQPYRNSIISYLPITSVYFIIHFSYPEF